jgi:hypothetical protein
MNRGLEVGVKHSPKSTLRLIRKGTSPGAFESTQTTCQALFSAEPQISEHRTAEYRSQSRFYGTYVWIEANVRALRARTIGPVIVLVIVIVLVLDLDSSGPQFCMRLSR